MLNMVLLSFISLQNAVCFIILTYLVPVLFTFYTQGVLKLKKHYSGAKRLNMVYTLLFSSSKCSLFHNFKVFGSCIIHYYIQGVLKLKNNSGAKMLTLVYTLHFFSSKRSLFHNSNIFGSCIIHFYIQDVLKLEK